jgi:hypothetical protein
MEQAENSEKTADNLKAYRFAPGQSGNPGGRPKTAALTRAYRNLLDEVCPSDPEGRTYAQLIAARMIRLAIGGNVQAAAEICDRVEGKPRMSIGLHREEEAIDVYSIIERLTGRRTEELGPGDIAPSGSDDAAG